MEAMFNFEEHIEKLIKFKDILNKIAEKRNISYNDLCSEAKINPFYLDNLLNGKTLNFPHSKLLKNIAEISDGNITYDELMKICG